MSISFNPELADVNNKIYVSGAITVGTTAVEAKVGASRISPREMVRIYNDSSVVVFYGASGVASSGPSKGEPIEPGASISIPAGDQLGIFLIVATGTASCIIQEMA